uniref:Large ribosomal subunit protein uL10-like insertion domain-containing protein n=1 Tax=Oryza nivara TaxID=4536 RepID=A0A0E0IXY7_ORYNI
MEEEAGAEVPLLKIKGDYHQGCPGCAYDRKKEVYRGLPYKEFLYLWMICLTAALPISSLFPFLYFMIRDLHVAKRTEDIGFYAGFVDRIGRKPVVVFGIFAAYAIEVCRPEHEALALSLVSTAWGIGLIIGPAIGGYLSQRNFPMSFPLTHCLQESDRKYGGLSLSSEDVGQVLAITGSSLLVYQLFIYPRINKILCIPILFAYPYMTYLSGPGLTIILNIASVIKNNLGPQDQRGAANGLAMTGMSFFKAVAPAGAGIVFSWAQKRQHASFLPGDQMVFFLLNLFELLGLILTFKPFLAPFRRLALLLPDPESSSCELALAVAAMAIKRTKAEKKVAYDKKLCQLLDEYTKVLIAVADNVGSNQLQEIRKGLRGDSIVLMGKNTLIRRCIKVHADNTGNKDFLELMPLLVGNVGLIFTKGDLKEVREEVAKYKVGAPARVGLVAPVDVVVPPGNTGLDPSQTSFFQVLNIPTKINKGTVEIITPVELIKKGDKVGSSESALLAKLGIRPFSYGLVITNVYDSGSVFSPEVLDLTEEDLMEKFASGVSMVASVSLAISYPTIAAAPHMFLNGYKNVLAVAVETEYSYPHADKIKEYLKDPSKFAVAAAVAAADSGAAAPAASKEEEKKEEPEEESDDRSMGSSEEEAAAPLLLLPAAAAAAEERCPGCVQEQRKARRGGRIPYTELFFVAVTTLASSLPITCLFPFLYFMVRDLQVAQTEEDIGNYAGFLGASYMVGRSFAAIFWGVVADRIGRKPVIMVIFNTLFGLSTKYWMALTTRFVLGALNGLLAPIKVNTAWGLGLVVGPALGGYLAQILSLWAVSDRKYGGLSFSSEDIGQVLAAAAAMMKSALAITISTGISLLQNNAVLQEHRGTANGVSTTAVIFQGNCSNSHGRKNVRMPSSFQVSYLFELHCAILPYLSVLRRNSLRE